MKMNSGTRPPRLSDKLATISRILRCGKSKSKNPIEKGGQQDR
jgi:hypothetical protein